MINALTHQPWAKPPINQLLCKTIEPEEIWRVIGNYAQAARRANPASSSDSVACGSGMVCISMITVMRLRRDWFKAPGRQHPPPPPARR